jgi:hypothetical protein
LGIGREERKRLSQSALRRVEKGKEKQIPHPQRARVRDDSVGGEKRKNIG